MTKNNLKRFFTTSVLLIFSISNVYAEIEKDLTGLFAKELSQDKRLDHYPKHWRGQYKNKVIKVNFTEIDAKKAQGSYQIDSKVTVFNTACRVTKLPYIYKLLIRDKSESNSVLTFWLNLQDQKNLTIDKSFAKQNAQDIRFKLQATTQ